MAEKRKKSSEDIVQATPAQFLDYAEWLRGLTDLVRASRVKASVAVNRKFILFYWRIGRHILEQQAAQGWGPRSSINWLPTCDENFRRYQLMKPGHR